MIEEDTHHPQNRLKKPRIFTVGANIGVRYTSVQETRHAHGKSATGFVIADDNGCLVIEEYHNYTRQNEHRHVILDTHSMDVFSQTANQLQRLGQTREVDLGSPPWESKFDTISGGLPVVVFHDNKYEWIQEGIYKYVDPDLLDQPESWDWKTPVEDPIPDKMQEHNHSEAVYSPPVDIDSVINRRS